MQRLDIEASFQNHYDFHHDAAGGCDDSQPHYCYAVSVNAAPGLGVQETADRARRRNGKVRLSTAGRVVAAGFSILESLGRREIDSHCDVFIEDGSRAPTPVELDELEAGFDPEIDNPWLGRLK